MTNIWRGSWVVAYREILRIIQDRTRLFSSFAMPVIFLVIFGAGFNKTMGALAPGIDFIQFLFPGIVAQTVFNNSIISGASLVWDREFGFLRELLVAPIPRAGIVAGKIIGAAAIAMVQAFVILLLAPIVHVSLNLVLILKLIPLLALISVSLSSLGILISTRIRSQQGFQVMIQLIVMPMLFLSGVFFPLSNVPTWLSVASKLNPLTYGIDAVRQLFLSDILAQAKDIPGQQEFSLGVKVFGHTMTIFQDACVIGIVGIVLITLATWSFNRQD